MKSLKGKVALITGVGSKDSIGYCITHRLAISGADLFIHSFHKYDVEMSGSDYTNSTDTLLKKIAAYAVRIEHLDINFCDAGASENLINRTIDKFGHIDILIINHTHDTLKTLDQLDADEIDRHLSVNIRASLLLVQHFVRQHDGRSGGRIILLTSGQHLGPMPHMAYVASKGALQQLTTSLSAHCIEKGITVNTVNPGPTKTYIPDQETDKAVLSRMPQGRWGEPDDAARLIAWLVSDEAVWITGQVIDSEGGFRRG